MPRTATILPERLAALATLAKGRSSADRADDRSTERRVMPAPIVRTHLGFVPPEPDPASRMIVQSVVAFVDALAAIGIVVAVLAMCIARGG